MSVPSKILDPRYIADYVPSDVLGYQVRWLKKEQHVQPPSSTDTTQPIQEEPQPRRESEVATYVRTPREQQSESQAPQVVHKLRLTDT